VAKCSTRARASAPQRESALSLASVARSPSHTVSFSRPSAPSALAADWVVLSACNTAAGEKGNYEALAGLARAVFYAGARALLVSHWYVDSEAAVGLTTRAFDAMRSDPTIGRAEALRRSMVQLITAGSPDHAHPEYWAPFVLVGDAS
jgi:CHAT domain-containing protein